jgi:uncharacterized protein YbaP (TraB family)
MARGTRRALLRAAALAAALPAASCAYRSIPGWTYAPPAFRLNRDGAPGELLLLGSVHAGLERFYPLPDAIERAFAGSRRLIVEIDTVARRGEVRAAGAARALLPDGATLSDVLQPSTRRALRSAFHDRPWELRALQRLQPWALALLLPDSDDARLGADPREGVEQHLVRRARARGMAVIELESADAQVRAFAGGTLAEQDAALALRLAQRDAHARTYVRIVDAWRRGDLDALAALKDFAFPPAGPLAPLRHRLFAERDAALAERLSEALDDPAPGIATVGTLHLAGPDALQHALAARGVVATRRPTGGPGADA